jgi:hypothetical protein
MMGKKITIAITCSIGTILNYDRARARRSRSRAKGKAKANRQANSSSSKEGELIYIQGVTNQRSSRQRGKGIQAFYMRGSYSIRVRDQAEGEWEEKRGCQSPDTGG